MNEMKVWGLRGQGAAAALLLGGLLVLEPDPGIARAQGLLPPTRALTAEQVERLEKVIRDKGTGVQLPTSIAGVLRLAPEQVGPGVRQATFLGDDGAKHGFALLNDHSGYLLFRRPPGVGLSVYRVDLKFHAVGAAREFQGARFIELAPDAARRELEEEIASWSRVLSPRGVSLPPVARPDAHKVRPPAASAAPAQPDH